MADYKFLNTNNQNAIETNRFCVGARTPNGYINGFTDKILLFNFELDPYNPLGLPPNTIRVQYKTGTIPENFKFDSQTLVDSVNNIWDVHFTGDSANLLFYQDDTKVLKIIGANTTGITDMSYMFNSCDNLTEIALFDTSSVTNMKSMFNSCTSLVDGLPLFDTSNVTDMSYMFYGCESLKELPLWNTSNVTNFDRFCYYCFDLITVPNFDFSSATILKEMFFQCKSLLTVPAFNFPVGTDFSDMFHSCDEFTDIPLFTMPNAVIVKAMFTNNRKVKSGALALYQRLSTQANPPTSHGSTFWCGQDTQTGSQEWNQIPESWGGNATG